VSSKRGGGIAGALAARGIGQPGTRGAFGGEEDPEPASGRTVTAEPSAPPYNGAAANAPMPTPAPPVTPPPPTVTPTQVRGAPPKRSNRTFRASDSEFQVIDQLRRTLFIDGRCAKMADTSDILRCALRLAAKLPIDVLVDDLIAHADEG
jgi:hypothetical protein